jgi:hypothetical protein
MTEGESGAAQGTANAETFRSKLTHGRDRFLAHVVVHGLQIGRRTPDDFIRHFPPASIMDGLRDRPWLRANILSVATGLKKKVAVKKSAESAGEDLQIALDEGETDPDTIVAHFDPDDRIRYLDDAGLWAYITEGNFWQTSEQHPEEFARAQKHIAFMLEQALTDELLSHRDIVEGIGVDTLAELLPREQLGGIITQALEVGHGDAPFTDADLLRAVPPTALVEHVPLTTLWDHVIAAKVADPHGFTESSQGRRFSSRPPSSESGSGPGHAAPAAPSVPSTQAAPPRPSAPAGSPSAPAYQVPATPPVSGSSSREPASSSGSKDRAQPSETGEADQDAEGPPSSPASSDSMDPDVQVEVADADDVADMQEDWEEDTHRGIPLEQVNPGDDPPSGVGRRRGSRTGKKRK